MEPSLLDYARFYGLTRNHLEQVPLQDVVYPSDFFTELEDPPGAFQIDASQREIPLETLSLDRDAAILLTSIKKFSASKEPLEFDGYKIPDSHRVRNMKLELPLLRTDHEFDMLDFRYRGMRNLAEEHLPLESVDEENDEGLSWPVRFFRLPTEFNLKSESEKLDITKDTLLYLQRVLQLHREGGIHDRFVYDEKPYKRSNALDPVSPPLLPRSPSPEPYIPSSEVGHIDLLSDQTSPTRQLIEELDRNIFTEEPITIIRGNGSISQVSDPMLLDIEDIGAIYSPLKGIQDLPSSPVRRQKTHDILKVEGPLTPPRSDQPPPWKSKPVPYQDALRELLPELPPPIRKPEETSSDDIDTFFAETIAPIAVKAERGIEQEQLQEADTTRRVPIPIMDFSLPTAPWKLLVSADKVGAFLAEIKSEYLSKHTWPTIGKIERALRWAPFPAQLGKAAVAEEIAGEGLIEPFIAQPECVDPDTLTWKPEGLRVLDDSDDEELENGTFPDENDLKSLVRKRKLEMQDPDAVAIRTNTQGLGNLAITNTDKEFIGRCKKRMQENLVPLKGSVGSEDTALGGEFSALESLSNFLNIRNRSFDASKVEESRRFPTDRTRIPVDVVANDTMSLSVSGPPQIPVQNSKPEPLPAPQTAVSTASFPFIVSSTFMCNRRLARQVQQLSPWAEFIERDFNLHKELSRQHSSHTDGTLIKPMDSVENEADIILSPGIGLITTTLQQIKQRSLPGQVVRSSLREGIIQAAKLYEMLLIIVSEGSEIEDATDANARPDASDCEALADFMSFSTVLDEEIKVLYVGGGGDELAKWIADAMARYKVSIPGMTLLQDETLWEIFLRRGGMNAFAAQAVLADLKVPEAVENNSPAHHLVLSNYGLMAFVKMGVDERIKRFEHLLGGQQLLRRVSKRLDAYW